MKNGYDINEYGGRDGLLKTGRWALSFFDSDKYGNISKLLEELIDDGTVNREKLNTSTHNIIEQLIPESKKIGLQTKSQIEGLVKIYYLLGEHLLDLYVGFADHIHEKFLELQKGNKEVKVIFDGRDSLGFYNVYCKRYGKGNAIFTRNNRGCLMSYSPGIENSKTQRLENETIINFYKRNSLLDKNLLFVDSGFNGTLPRLHQAILQKNGIIPPNINIELLVYYDNHQNIEEMIGGNFKTHKIKNNDDRLKNNIDGYLNNILGQSGKELRKIDPFRKTLQELSAYIKEARTDGLLHYNERPENDKKTDFSLDSIQNITAKYNFMKGLMSVDIKNYETSNEEILNRIKEFKFLYLEYKNIFGNLLDFQEKIILNKQVKDISDMIYTLLTKNNLRQVVG